MPLQSVSLDELTIEDEASFAHVATYARLKHSLRASEHRFLVPDSDTRLSWDRATFLNLTFWNAQEGTDVLCERCIPADVVAHVAWHQLAAERLPGPEFDSAVGPGACSLLFAEAIASAFDLYLVGRLLPNVPDSGFIATQVAIMHEAAGQAGMDDEGFAALLDSVVADPEQAFEDLRALLFDVSRAFLTCGDAVAAQLLLERVSTRRFEPLLHHYELSNWVIYSRAHGTAAPDQERAVLELDATLRAAPASLDWLTEHWLEPAT